MRLRLKQISGGICVVMCVTISLNIFGAEFSRKLSIRKVSSFRKGLVEAKTLSDEGLTLLVTIVTAQYRTMADNWLCNTKHMNIHKQIVMIVTDRGTAQMLQNNWPEIKALHVNLPDDFSGELKFKHASYNKLMVWRTKLIYAFLKRGMKLLHFEVDSVWIKNPLREVEKYADNDMVVAAVQNKPKEVCGCFIYLNPTVNTVALWEALRGKMHGLYNVMKATPVDTKLTWLNNDQIYLSDLLYKDKFQVSFRKLLENQMPEGPWYDLPDDQKYNGTILVIHNNWIEGVGKKLQRAQKSGQWFLDDDSKCNQDTVMEYIRRFS